MITKSNTMPVFFSGTDTDELNDNSRNHNFYLSLIVNNYLDMIAKIAFVGKTKNEKVFYQCNDESGEIYELEYEQERTKEVLFIYDCKIESPKQEISIPDRFQNRVKFIKEKAEQELKSKAVQLPVSSINRNSWATPEYKGNYAMSNNSIIIEQEQEDDIFNIISDSEEFATYILKLGKREPMTDESFENAIMDLETSDNRKTIMNLIVKDLSKYYKEFFETENGLSDEFSYLSVIDNLIEEFEEWKEEYKCMNYMINSLSSLKGKIEKQLGV